MHFTITYDPAWAGFTYRRK